MLPLSCVHKVCCCEGIFGLIERYGVQKFGSLWGVPGVVEQPIRRGKETALIFPIPAQVEGAVSQVSLLMLIAFRASFSRM